MRNVSLICITAATVLAFKPMAVIADAEAELGAAKASLFAGRNYLVGFPATQTREELRENYLGVDQNGIETNKPSLRFSLLENALDTAVHVRNEAASLDDWHTARIIAWESLEALLQGQLIAGNGNYLKGLRVAFPVTTTDAPGGDTALPFGSPGMESGAPYNGANITDLCYARLHFLRGISSALGYLATDSTGEIRASDLSNQPFPQYTHFNTAELPDPVNWGTDAQTSQTTGYLLGNILGRYGESVVNIGDRLWRGAYFDKNRAPGGSRAYERQEMLSKAMSQLQRGVHSQFMAALPLAATLDEIDYQLCQVDQIRTSAATASSLIDHIRHGDIPKLTNLNLDSSTAAIKQQIAYVQSLKSTVKNDYDIASGAIWKEQQAVQDTIAEAISIHDKVADNLFKLIAIDVGSETSSPYYALSIPVGRANFASDLANKIDQMIKADVQDPVLTESGDLGTAILQMRRAFSDIDSEKLHISDTAAQIRIEQERNRTADVVLSLGAEQISADQLAIGIANSVSVSISAGVDYTPPATVTMHAGVNVTYNPGAIDAAGLQGDITRAQAIQQAQINDINSSAQIKNLLLQENQYKLDLNASIIQGQVAIAGVNNTLAQINHLIEDQVFYQSKNTNNWYHDPALIFEQDASEIAYHNSLTEYVDQLYILSQQLQGRWSEGFSNPYLVSDGAQTLGSGLYDGFTQPESVFNVYVGPADTSVGLATGDDYLNALQAWDNALRKARSGGQANVSSVISLRRDIFGFSEIYYDNTNCHCFKIDPATHDVNVGRFRALLLRNAQSTPPPFALRLEFPLTYAQASRSYSGSLSIQPMLLPVSRSDWNIRITGLSTQIAGNNVAQSANNLYRINLVQYGKLEYPQYFPRDPGTYPNFLTYDLPLYYDDPEKVSTSPFSFVLEAGINGASGTTLNLADQTSGANDVEPTPFCDRYVLLIERAANTSPINLQNVDDIILTIQWYSGIPPTFF